MKKLKYLLFIFIVLFSSNVYASEFNMNNYTSATQGGTKNRYRATEIDYTGIAATYQFNTRYTGRISMLETYFSYPFEANTTYTLTYNMATEDFRNNFSAYYWWDCDETMNSTNQHTGSFSYISYKKVKFSFKPSENTTCIRVMLGSSNLSSKAITGISNWNLSSITIYDPDWQSGSGSGQGTIPAPTPSPNSNQDIINNQTNNTQDIINNNNQNTQDLIENNNQNTQNIIDNQNELLGNKCYNLFDNSILPLTDVSYSTATTINTGVRVTTLNTGNSQYIVYKLPDLIGKKISLHLNMSSSSSNIGMARLYYGTDSNPAIQNIGDIYNRNGGIVRTLADSYPNNTNGIYLLLYSNRDGSGFTTGAYVDYTNIILNIGDYKPYCEFGSFTSKFDKFDETLQFAKNSIDEQNQYLMDNSNPNISDNDFLNTFNSVGVSDPLNYLLTLPTQLINKIVSLADNCQSIDLGTLYGVHITLPCLNIGDIVGSNVWNIIDVIFSVSLLAVIFKNLYDTFSNLLTMGAEKEAKEKFSMPTPMDFLSMILGGDR